MTTPRYKRIVLKLSGEAFKGESEHVIDPATIKSISSQIKSVVEMSLLNAEAWCHALEPPTAH